MATAQVFSERDHENAELIGLLLMTAQTLRHIAPSGGVFPADGRQWMFSLIAHACSRYGDGRQLEADTLALARSLGMNVEQVVVSGPSAQAGLVH